MKLRLSIHKVICADKFAIIGRKTKQEYNFGDKVTVQIVGVDPKKRQIDLEIFEEY